MPPVSSVLLGLVEKESALFELHPAARRGHKLITACLLVFRRVCTSWCVCVCVCVCVFDTSILHT